jgi:nicotinate-nucleotide adenylyltransferase
MKIALFGGSFDPPHRGHIAIAQAAADAFALDRVLFTPAGRTLDAPLADGSPNYTVRTLELLAAQFPFADLFNLVGADTFQLLGNWREPYRLLALAEWIVVSRPGAVLAVPEGLTLTAAQRARIHLLDSVHEEVSASLLRQRLATQTGLIEDLLPVSVAGYIAEHGLYRGLLQ